MYIYVCILVLTCLFAALENKSRNLYLALFFVVFFLISALRADTVGYDLKNYIPLYNAISEMSWGGVFFFTDYELGYKLFNKLISFSLTCDKASVKDIAIGKKHINMTINTLGNKSNPNQIENNGPKTIIGTVCVTIKYG